MREINTVIIGSGISGLAMAKSCKDYGIEYLVIGKRSYVTACLNKTKFYCPVFDEILCQVCFQ